MELDFTPSPELLQKANTARTPEELQALAKENGMDITPEQAQDYFARLHQNGELEDDELDNVAGGGCYKGGKLIVTDLHVCEHWLCKRCGTKNVWIQANGRYNPDVHQCPSRELIGKNCSSCTYRIASGLTFLCDNPKNYKG